MLAIMLAAAIGQAAPSSEARALGRRLAATGTLATIMPLLVDKDLSDLAGEDPTLAADQKARLLAIGHAEGKTNMDRIVRTLGDAYAERLSIADLRLLVAQNETAATARWREAQPAAIGELMQALSGIDFKKTTAATFCAETGRLCARR